IIFTKIQCSVRNNLVTKVVCYLESSDSLAIEVTTNMDDIVTFVGLTNMNLFVYGRKNVIRMNGFRLEICKVLRTSTRPSLVTFFHKGIQQAKSNLHKCPFKRV
ncbi:hypothetical protein KR222_007630, partial [Zaprionus bogoriensis]